MSEHRLTGKRLIDLSRQAQRRGIVTFSDFLTLNELDQFHQNRNRYDTMSELSGGYPFAERQVAAFVPEALFYEWEYPIDCLMIVPAYPKFAEKLSHRDVLGAVMNLGIDRAKIGDILVKEEASYLFVKRELTSYICEQLTQIKHTLVHLALSDQQRSMKLEPSFEQFEEIVASSRLDNIVSSMIRCSRSEAVQFIQGGKVMINGKECLHNSYICKPNDTISIRSIGRFLFDGEMGVTRKNRVKIAFRKYV